MSSERIENPDELVSEGQEVIAEVISVDREDRKISLSLRSTDIEGAEELTSYLEQQADERETAQLGDVFGSTLSMKAAEEE